MTERQKEFLRALKMLGLSMTALICIGTLIRSEDDMMEFSRRLIELEDRGVSVAEAQALQTLLEMMKEVSEI